MHVHHPVFPYSCPCVSFLCAWHYIHLYSAIWGMVSNLLLSPLFLTVCPPGTYKPEGTPGGLSTCLSCPDLQHTSQPGSTSLSDCVCKPGYQQIGMTCQGKRNSSINWLTGPAPKAFAAVVYSQLIKHSSDSTCVQSMKNVSLLS